LEGGGIVVSQSLRNSELSYSTDIAGRRKAIYKNQKALEELILYIPLMLLGLQRKQKNGEDTYRKMFS
jgi:hypothetical protein